MSSPRPLIGAVLTGGKSTRFGSTKALAPVEGGLLAATAVTALRGVGCDPVVAVGGKEGHELGLPVVQDSTPHLGPLGGIASALVWAKTGHVLIVPCDLPLLRSIDLNPLVTWAREAPITRGAMATIGGRSHPIVAVWPASSGKLLARAVTGGTRRLYEAADLIDFDRVPLNPRAGQDADTPEELRRLLTKGPDSQ